MSWIQNIPPKNADSSLKKIYDKIFLGIKTIPNYFIANSLRPHTIESIIDFENSLLYSEDNKLPAWFIEAIGVYVGYLDGSEYCIEYHYNKMKSLLNNNLKAEEIRSALAENAPEKVFDVWEKVIIKFCEVLTKNPTGITEESIGELSLCGITDEEILEVVQVVSYFSFSNRIALGLGINIEDDLLGLSSHLK